MVPKAVSLFPIKSQNDRLMFCCFSGIVNVKSRESLVMNASEAVTAAEDPFGAAPFRLPPGNHDSLISVLLTVDLTRFQSILLFGYLFLFLVFLFCCTLLSHPDHDRSEKVTGGGTRWR